MNKILLFALTLIFSFQLSAQSDKYVKMMEKQVSILDSARTKATLTKLSNTFQRIANAEKEEWLPNYYQAYCQFRLANIAMQTGDINTCNAHIDNAQAALDLAKAVKKEDAEIYALQALIYQGRIWENPMSKGAEYSPLSHAETDKALALNPNHPRALYIKGQNIFYTPEFFGGGMKNAHPLLKAALASFNQFEVESSIHPRWGQSTNEYLLAKAEEKLADNGKND
ncbi:MAG: hypothetical protein MK226_13730 [Saprospiraceae bacterium]|nr:hypothetical protein [Saprospiraceae bacterium]